MTSLTPKKNLVEETKQLMTSVKRHFIAISENVYQLHETWIASPDEWVDFYENELELHKSQVSKMLKVGKASLEYGWREETVSIEKLYGSLNRHRDNPQLALAEAKTWTFQDAKEDKKEDGHNHEYAMYCGICWKKHP